MNSNLAVWFLLPMSDLHLWYGLYNISALEVLFKWWIVILSPRPCGDGRWCHWPLFFMVILPLLHYFCCCFSDPDLLEICLWVDQCFLFFRTLQILALAVHNPMQWLWNSMSAEILIRYLIFIFWSETWMSSMYCKKHKNCPCWTNTIGGDCFFCFVF